MKRNRKGTGIRHLYRRVSKSTGTAYFYYRRQDNIEVPMGSDARKAKQAAQILNERRYNLDLTPVELADKATAHKPGQPSLEEICNRFLSDYLPSRRIGGEPLSKSSLDQHRLFTRRLIESVGGNKPMNEVSQADVAKALSASPTVNVYNQMRSRLSVLWRFAVSEGYASDNLPIRIMPKDGEGRTRQRLTLEGYRATFAMARPAIQAAMELSMNALQRRSDIQKWHRDDQREGFAYIAQQKTRKHGSNAYIRIPMDLPALESQWGCRTLGEIIERCLRTDIPCPYLVHERPSRARKFGKTKSHPFQLTLNKISEGFATARDATGLFDNTPEEEKPTFHEILALSAHLHEEAGWDKRLIQALRGHTTERMTDVYLSGHAWTTIDWKNGAEK